MRRVLHLSDLHFGSHDPPMVEALAEAVAAAGADLVVVSGDLTQRARRSQFAAAAAFLGRLGPPVLAVPGNHDVPLFNPWRRFLAPLRSFHRHIGDGRAAAYADDEIAVLGLNTARALALKDGRLSPGELARLADGFAGARAPLRILVTHHPLLADGGVARRHRPALAAVAEAGVHLLLAGHHHQAAAAERPIGLAAGRSVLVVQAGTAVSTRRRGAANSFNRLEIDGGTVTVAVETWTGRGFETGSAVDFRFDGEGWRR